MYDHKSVTHYQFPVWDFGDGNTVDTVSFRGPAGMKGQVVKIGVMPTEAFACDTTPAKLELGTSGDSDAFAVLNIADGAADADCFDETDDADAIIDANIPADTLVQLKGTAGTDNGTAAGMGIPFVDIRWYN